MLDRSQLRIQDLHSYRALFISDIHGEKDLLEALLKKADYVPGKDFLFLLGDLIEKGSASLETLQAGDDTGPQRTGYRVKGK